LIGYYGEFRKMSIESEQRLTIELVIKLNHNQAAIEIGEGAIGNLIVPASHADDAIGHGQYWRASGHGEFNTMMGAEMPATSASI